MSSQFGLIEGIFHSSTPSRRHERLVEAARIIAALHPYAVDYIQQAPVLVLPAAQRDPAKCKDKITRTWTPLLAAQPKLRALMEHFEIAPQLRSLHGCVLQPRHWSVVQVISKVNPSTLAQAIPTRIGQQKGWLTNLWRWTAQMKHHNALPDVQLEWAVRELTYGSQAVVEIADFAARSDQFSPRWGLVQARAAAERWHAELARTQRSGGHRERYGLDWSDPVDYGKLPLALTVNKYDFVALRSAEDLFTEGKTMHNCVSSYFDNVHRGQSRIYSVRSNGIPIATLELGLPIMGIRQLKGPCNAKVSDEVSKAASKFMKKVKAG